MANGPDNSTKKSMALIIGCALVLYGLYKLLGRVFSPWWPSVSQFINTAVGIIWPLAVILAGVFVIVAVKKGTITSPSGKKLYRKRQDRMLGGVCAGIADFCGIDLTVVRVVSVVLLFASFFSIMVFYIILWIIIPEEPQGDSSWV